MHGIALQYLAGRTVPHHTAVATDYWGVAAALVACGLAVLVCYLLAGMRPPPRRTDQDDDSGHGGGGGPGRGPTPDGSPGWWPEFERQFAEHVERERRSEQLDAARRGATGSGGS